MYHWIGVLFIMLCGLSGSTQANEAPGTTEVLKWPEGREAAFYLAFDDGCISHLEKAIPELKKRGLTGTFYVYPGGGHYMANQALWEKTIPGSGMVLANHTFTHKGVTDEAQLDGELAKCNEVLKNYDPDNWPRLISFGRPGGVPWEVSEETQERLLAQYNLVRRDPFTGYPFQFKTKEEVLAYVDKTIAGGGVGHLFFHGVDGDWLVTPMDIFLPLLDKLVESRDRLWITDPISCHQYKTERGDAKVEIVSATATGIALNIQTSLDTNLYDQPLTLSTTVPVDWVSCVVQQGKKQTVVQVSGGKAIFDALPGGGEISLRKQ